ncbi:MAG: aldo/keto reductase [Anaerolineaceae bacterium]|nr:aldo/keto reductase [Anaerolineaceae bacterium]
MENRFLGKTGLRVSELCLGAMTFGREADEATSFEMMDAFVDAGGNFIDTANVYSNGLSEEVVGKWLKTKNRRDIVVATKVRFPMGEGPNDVGLSRKHIMDSVEDSLRRLGTDYIDLYQVHNFDVATPLRETLTTLDTLVKQGKVRYIGASNYKGYQLQKAIDLSKAMNLEPFTCLQPLYNLLDRAVEWELVEVCQNEGLGIIPWSPLRGGWLTGKYTRDMEGDIPENMRLKLATEFGWSESWENYGNNRTWDILEELAAVAKEVGKSVPQVALNWVKDRPGVTAPIIGARNMKQLTDNMGSVGWTLSDEQRQRLDDLSNMPGPYYSVIEQMMTRR